MTMSNILTKAVGVIGLGLVGYDAHVAGKINAYSSEKNHKADSLSERYLDDLKLDSPSITKARVKEELFKYSTDETMTGFFHNIGGYIRGSIFSVVGNVIPFGLALGAILGGGAAGRGLGGTVSKFCGVGLAAYGSIFLLQEVFGIGKSH